MPAATAAIRPNRAGPKLSVEEFLAWQRLIDEHGMRGLRTTRLQQYRRPGEDEEPRMATEGLNRKVSS